MSTATRVIKNTGYLYAKMGITMFISLYTTRLILNSLGASDFGIFNIVGGAIAMLGFLNGAMASATQRFMSYSEGEGNKEKQKSIFNVSLILHFGIAFIVGIALLIAGYFFFNGILNIPADRTFAAQVVYGSLIVSTIFTVMTVPYDAAMNAHENMKYYAIVGIIESFLKLTVALVCVYTSYDKLIVYGSLMACIPLITLTIMRVYCHKHYEECTIRIRRYWDKGLMKEMTGFAGWNLFQSAAAIITNNGGGQLMALTNNLSKAINPIITKTEGKKQHDKVLEFSSSCTKATYFVTSLFALPAIISMPQLLKFWLKNVPDYAVFFAQCQLIISLCEQLTSGYNTAITASGKIRGISLLKAITKFSYLPISYILFKLNVSIIVVYCILVIIQGILNGLLIPVYFLERIFCYSHNIYLKKTFFPCIISTLFVLVVGVLLSYLLYDLTLLLVTFICCIICNIIFFYSISLSKEERSIITQIISKLFKRRAKNDRAAQ